jgi:hypothetical protein
MLVGSAAALAGLAIVAIAFQFRHAFPELYRYVRMKRM